MFPLCLLAAMKRHQSIASKHVSIVSALHVIRGNALKALMQHSAYYGRSGSAPACLQMSSFQAERHGRLIAGRRSLLENFKERQFRRQK